MTVQLFFLPLHVFSVQAKVPDQDMDGSTVKAEAKETFFSTQVQANKEKYRDRNFTVLNPIMLVPGGEAIGIRLKRDGLEIIGFQKVIANQESPGQLSDLRIGDVLEKINGHPLEQLKDIRQWVNWFGKEGKAVELLFDRQGQKIKAIVTPQLDPISGDYRLGLILKDAITGIGTLTFYDPLSRKYGALGHSVSLSNEGLIPLSQGEIFKAIITGIDKGESGNPGGKQATIDEKNQPLGNINQNTPFGIFGEIYKGKENQLQSKEGLPIATENEIKLGKAELLTVVEGEKVERFNIDILRKEDPEKEETKGLIIKVTDPRLIAKTGGIVQGMSGSPIIQDGKIIGAVTHVFVDDPTMGYGTYIEWMLKEGKITEELPRVALGEVNFFV